MQTTRRTRLSILAVALGCAVALLVLSSAAGAATGTRYKLRSVTATETVTLKGPTTAAGAPATLAITMVLSWKAGPAGSEGIATISKDPEAGLKRLCAGNVCPSYGPMDGSVTIKGTVTPAGGKPISCATKKSLKSLLEGSSLFGSLDYAKLGGKRQVLLSASQYSYLLQSAVPDPACFVIFDPGLVGTGIVTAFDPSKLGGATLTTSFKKAYPLTANPPGQTAGAVKGKLTVAATATLARL